MSPAGGGARPPAGSILLGMERHDIAVTACPGCGIELPEVDGPTHPYLGASPACWALYGEVLAREYEDPERFSVHQLTVDAYAVQHPGRPERRTIQSLSLHLVMLCLLLERGIEAARAPVLRRRALAAGGWEWLDAPRPNGSLTVAHVHEATTAAEHVERVREWAHDVWLAWAPHHDVVRSRAAELEGA